MAEPNIRIFSIAELFGKTESSKYVIPMYQRDYAWSDDEVQQLIVDIDDYVQKSKDLNKNELPYYIGSLVVYRVPYADNTYELIDGQQRFTTLTIMLKALSHMEDKKSIQDKVSDYCQIKLSFEHREASEYCLKNLGGKPWSNRPHNIEKNYNLIKSELQKKNNLEEFVDYMLNNVKIMRIEVPQDTDLNHYFEIMNSRGEQLEKHEILKARLINKLKYNNKTREKKAFELFNLIWESCSDMSAYVQMNMRPDYRRIFFGDSLDNLLFQDFDDMLDSFVKITQNEESTTVDKDEYKEYSVNDIYKESNPNKFELPAAESELIKNNNNNSEFRFASIINFPNFLLHVLRILTKGDDIMLDDKELLTAFDKYIKTEISAKNFIFCLLKVRFLFDKFVIKHDYSKDLTKDEETREAWLIQHLLYKKNDLQYYTTFNNFTENIRMLESMFHFSYSTQIRKHWLYAVLKYTYNNPDPNPKEFYNMLYELACSYMTKHYLATNPIDFMGIIDGNNEQCISNCDFNNLNKGCKVERFVFNFYDFVVWATYKETDKKYSSFRFTYRTSVEHLYPQHPVNGNWLDKAENDNTHQRHQNIVDCFGNLCLITSSMNSRFNNHMPDAKYADYGKGGNVKTLSIKLWQMFNIMEEKDGMDWSETDIIEFTKQCCEVLAKNLGIDYTHVLEE